MPTYKILVELKVEAEDAHQAIGLAEEVLYDCLTLPRFAQLPEGTTLEIDSMVFDTERR